VAVAENVGLHDNFLTDDPLDGEAAAFYFRRYTLDNHTSPSIAVGPHAFFFGSTDLNRLFLAEGHRAILFAELIKVEKFGTDVPKPPVRSRHLSHYFIKDRRPGKSGKGF
jgi:hypothetical protein